MPRRAAPVSPPTHMPCTDDVQMTSQRRRRAGDLFQFQGPPQPSERALCGLLRRERRPRNLCNLKAKLNGQAGALCDYIHRHTHPCSLIVLAAPFYAYVRRRTYGLPQWIRACCHHAAVVARKPTRGWVTGVGMADEPGWQVPVRSC